LVGFIPVLEKRSFSVAARASLSPCPSSARLSPRIFRNVLAARGHYTVKDPYERADTPDSRPTFGLDDGETDGIVLANALAVDGFLTDEFGGTNFPLIHAVLQGPRLIPTPRLICDYAWNGHLTHENAKTLLTTISPHRSWENSPYVTQLFQRLEE
jgi:hypothetical protein